MVVDSKDDIRADSVWSSEIVASECAANTLSYRGSFVSKGCSLSNATQLLPRFELTVLQPPSAAAKKTSSRCWERLATGTFS